MRALILPLAVAAVLAGVAAQASRGPDAEALAAARREADQANDRSQGLEREARAATSAAARARAEGEALAARIEGAEAELTASERRIAIIAALQEEQRARLAARQGPLVRLVAALQVMARRPAALALIQPGSVDDTVHVRSLLAAALPEIRRRTTALRAEVAQGAALRDRADQARGGLQASRAALRERRAALAGFEAAQRARSSTLAGLSLSEGDRALAFGEEARALASNLGSREEQARRAAALALLPGPVPRPTADGRPEAPAQRLSYQMPVEGRLLVGVGEISDGGIHSRGLTFETAADARVVAPANGRVAYAGRFRSYGNVVIIDHGNGWSSVITNLASLAVANGERVARGGTLGRTGRGAPRVTVELRRAGRPVPIAQIVSG